MKVMNYLMVGAIVLGIGAIAALIIPQYNNEFVKTTYSDWGTVQSVENCKLSRRTLSCAVKTDKYTFSSLRLDYFPKEFLQPGDNIGVQFKHYTNKREKYYCRGGWCSNVSVCLSWMPCWDELN